MQKLLLTVPLLICGLALSGCASNSPVPPPKPQKQLPAVTFQKREADFASRMRNFLFESPSEPTPLSTN